MTRPTPLIMDKGSMQAYCCSEWTELWFGTLQGSIPLFRDDRTRIVRVYYPLQVFIIDWLLILVNRKPHTSGSRLKGTNSRQKTCEFFHVYFIFYSGFMCQTTVIFGITKGGSLVLNNLAS